jgi:hypothetical protein
MSAEDIEKRINRFLVSCIILFCTKLSMEDALVRMVLFVFRALPLKQSTAYKIATSLLQLSLKKNSSLLGLQ